MEQIGIYGLDLLFMPRKLVNMDKIFHESPSLHLNGHFHPYVRQEF